MLNATIPQADSVATSSLPNVFPLDRYSYNELASIDIDRFGGSALEVLVPSVKKTAPKIAALHLPAAVYTTIAQWVGSVEEVLSDGSLVAHLRALSLVGHAAPPSSEGFEEWTTIPRSQIEPEDIRYARAGATFYMTVVKERRQGALLGGTSVVIVFRKVPVWNRSQVELYRQRAAELFAKIHGEDKSKVLTNDRPRPELSVPEKPRSVRVTIHK
ncbi:hypothetical protein [Ralstonia sp. A12]|uniref:hypothetical protein n=1 Tax=Ralstonia sp. A12 TaxID=1217052 RepID=UPI0012EDD7F9|nr:hypothetical protein [Ralstonia sp. A12]